MRARKNRWASKSSKVRGDVRTAPGKGKKRGTVAAAAAAVAVAAAAVVVAAASSHSFSSSEHAASQCVFSEYLGSEYIFTNNIFVFVFVGIDKTPRLICEDS